MSLTVKIMIKVYGAETVTLQYGLPLACFIGDYPSFGFDSSLRNRFSQEIRSFDGALIASTLRLGDLTASRTDIAKSRLDFPEGADTVTPSCT